MNKLFLCMDAEFSSLDENSDLLTLYMGIFNKKTLIDELDLKLIPDSGRITIDPDSMRVNNLDLRGWDGIKYKEASKLIDKFIRKYTFDDTNPKYPLPIGNRLQPVGQAVGGDIKRVQKSLVSQGRWDESVERIPLDTLQYAMILRDREILNLDSISLQNLVMYFNLDEMAEEMFGRDILMGDDGQTFHTARYDAVISYVLYLKLKELL